MAPTHVLAASAARTAPPALAPLGIRRSAALPSLTRHAAPSLSSGLILALIVLALLLQASFFVWLASGQLDRGGEPGAAPAVRVR